MSKFQNTFLGASFNVVDLDAFHNLKAERDELSGLLQRVQRSGALNPAGNLYESISIALTKNKVGIIDSERELRVKVEALHHALKTIQLRYNESFLKEHQELIAKAISYATN